MKPSTPQNAQKPSLASRKPLIIFLISLALLLLLLLLLIFSPRFVGKAIHTQGDYSFTVAPDPADPKILLVSVGLQDKATNNFFITLSPTAPDDFDLCSSPPQVTFDPGLGGWSLDEVICEENTLILSANNLAAITPAQGKTGSFTLARLIFSSPPPGDLAFEVTSDIYDIPVEAGGRSSDLFPGDPFELTEIIPLEDVECDPACPEHQTCGADGACVDALAQCDDDLNNDDDSDTADDDTHIDCTDLDCRGIDSCRAQALGASCSDNSMCASDFCDTSLGLDCSLPNNCVCRCNDNPDCGPGQTCIDNICQGANEICDGQDNNNNGATDEDVCNTVENCGSFENACGPYDHATPGCTAGECTLSCEAGWLNTNNNPTDGCEEEQEADCDPDTVCAGLIDPDTCEGGDDCTGLINPADCPDSLLHCLGDVNQDAPYQNLAGATNPAVDGQDTAILLRAIDARRSTDGRQLCGALNQAPCPYSSNDDLCSAIYGKPDCGVSIQYVCESGETNDGTKNCGDSKCYLVGGAGQ